MHENGDTKSSRMLYRNPFEMPDQTIVVFFIINCIRSKQNGIL